MFPLAVPPSLGQHVPVPVHCCGLSLLIMCSAATRPVSLILLIRETDTQRMELQPFPTRRWAYGRVADEQNPEWCRCLGHTCCWTGICGTDVASPQPIGGKSVSHCILQYLCCNILRELLFRLTHAYRPCPIWFLCHTGLVNGNCGRAKHKRFCLQPPWGGQYGQFCGPITHMRPEGSLSHC